MKKENINHKSCGGDEIHYVTEPASDFIPDPRSWIWIYSIPDPYGVSRRKRKKMAIEKK